MPSIGSGISVGSGIGVGTEFGPYVAYTTASALLAAYPSLAGQDNYYLLYPGGSSSAPQWVWCDMTTNGGGYMMVARSHPTTVNYSGYNWGWQGGPMGNVRDFTQAYQAGWWTYWNGNATFTEYIFGNRSNINNNAWGPFIYRVSGINYTTFLTVDSQQGYTNTTIKSDTAVYGTSAYPGMQGAIGYPVTGTANNFYYMRDCCGFAPYGGTATSMVTTYCGADFYYAGTWCGGSTTDGSGNFLNGTFVSNGLTYGGTNQYMIMVR
jgi:hypothetical protein